MTAQAEPLPSPSSRASQTPRMALSKSSALPIAMAAWAIAGLGDWLTTAEVGFTLLYLVPIGIAVWWRGLGAGLAMCALCTATFVFTWLMPGPFQQVTPGTSFILVWNVGGEIGVFLAFAYILAKLHARLDREVSARESAVVQLRHADRLNTIGKLASGVAHELGTPLNVVAGRAWMIASKRAAGDDACRSADVIARQAERMTTIIKGLLDFARRGGTRKAPVELRRLVRETATLLASLAEKSSVTIDVEDGPPDVAWVNTSEVQQVLTNLVVNAIQAMPAGGRVHVALETRGKVVRIKVRDEGEGIPPDVMPHIFDPFFTTKDVGVGTGLGLSVSYGIVRDHGGWIEAHSKPGEGAELVVCLPRSDPSS